MAARVKADAPIAGELEAAIAYVEWRMGQKINAVHGCRVIPAQHLGAMLTALASLQADNARKDRALTTISNWRADSAAYTDRMNLPRRKMDEAQVIHMEREARAALNPEQGEKLG